MARTPKIDKYFLGDKVLSLWASGDTHQEISDKITKMSGVEISRRNVSRYILSAEKRAGVENRDNNPGDMDDLPLQHHRGVHPEMGEGMMPSFLASALYHMERLFADTEKPDTIRLKAADMVIQAAIYGSELEVQERYLEVINDMEEKKAALKSQAPGDVIDI